MHADSYANSDPARTRRLLAVGATAAVLLVVGFLVYDAINRPKPDDALALFLAAWHAGDYEGAAGFTDGDPAAVAAALEANVDGLDGATFEADVEEISESGGEATATITMTWAVPEIGDFTYTNQRVQLTESEDEWQIRWSERVVHPELERGERLGTVTTPEPRAPILDRDGRELVSLQPVVEVGVIPSELDDEEAAVEEVAELTGADAETFAESVAAAEPDNFVPAITLRQEEFDAIEQELKAIPGTEFGQRELPLAPTRDFARAVLGTVGPVTEEQLEESEGELEIGDEVGQSGLQAEFEEQLAGTPTREVVIRDEEGEPVETLHAVGGEAGEPLETTLDLTVQSAAEKALGDIEGNAALVAVEPATGAILAAANRPTEDGFNRAFAGQYPPGSTFKVITTTALFGAGLDPEETVDCPETINVGGRQFVNFEGSAAGAVPFSTDFAQSCNTAFVSLTDMLEPDSLKETAETYFGFGERYGLPLESFSGQVPRGRDEAEEAAAMIGQARILASPLTMAEVAATVQSGVWHRPRLLTDDPEEEGEPLPAEAAETLRILMRSVVTSGTGTALALVPGEPIGKSGTAEYGSGDPPPTHAWFIAAREDVAVAVIVEDATSGGEVAAPIVADFLTRLG
jgi:cell division protein FtsI/penicillin-binding protein 2